MDDWKNVFVQTAERLLNPRLTEFGFVRAPIQHGNAYCSQGYLSSADNSEQLYVLVSVSFDARDKPWFVRVSIGQGALDSPEVDWNGLPLWRLVEAHDRQRVPSYEFNTPATLEVALHDVARDLFTHGEAFLRGDVTEFRALRAELNKSRTPYSIQRRDSTTGQHRTGLEKESAELKRRFSDG